MRSHERNGNGQVNGQLNGSRFQKIGVAPEPIQVDRFSIGGAHWYEATKGKVREHIAWLQSVTHFTKHAPKGDFLMKWYADLGWDKAEQYKKEKGIQGTESHRLQQAMDNGETVETKYLHPDVVRQLMTYRNFVEDWTPQFVSNEEIVYDLEEGVAGTLDKRYVLPAEIVEKNIKGGQKFINDEIGGIHVVHDSKSGKAIYPEQPLQVNKYADLRNKMGIDPDVGVPVEWILILRLNTKHKRGYEVMIERVSEERTRVFDCLKTVVDHLFPEKGPRFPEELPREIKLPE